MTSFPRIRLEPSGIEVIDFKPAQSAIRAKYGPSYHRSEDALREAAALWGFKPGCKSLNSAGVWSSCDEVLEWQIGRCSAEICLGRSPSDLWSMTTGYMTTISGAGSAPSIWNPIAFLSRDDARQAGLAHLIERLRGIAIGKESDAAPARKLMERLEADHVQPSLF